MICSSDAVREVWDIFKRYVTSIFSSELCSNFLILMEEQSGLVKNILFLPNVAHSVRVKPEKMFKPRFKAGYQIFNFCISHWSLFFISKESHMQNARIVKISRCKCSKNIQLEVFTAKNKVFGNTRELINIVRHNLPR